MSETRQPFRAEVSRLLDIVVHSLYSEKEIFLRELISNASDACDKLRYQALTQPDLLPENEAFRIQITTDAKARTLTISDNGIGMSRDELIENLGTIARSGTAAFLDQIKDGKKPDINMIGQFGVGFYAAFMVAQMVEVKSRKAGSAESWCWRSDGKGDFAVEEDPRTNTGTEVILYLKQGEDEFLLEDRLRAIITRYSDHIAVPIILNGNEKPANRASALWMRSKSDVTEDDYKEFYRHVSHAFDDPVLTLHWKAEGVIDYTGLLFVPGTKPYDLFDPKRQHGVKLYVRRVFITNEAEGLVPPYLRFLRGVIDSEDLPLNVSREMLQYNPTLAKIKQGVIRRTLGDLAKFAEDQEKFASFWDNFGAVLKEGLYEDQEHRAELLKIARFKTTASDGLVSLADYVAHMKEGQDAIYYINGDNLDALKRSPHLEGFKSRGIEVLLLTDTVDDFWPGSVTQYEGKSFKSVTRAGDDLDKVPHQEDKKEQEKAPEGEIDTLVALFKVTLGDAIKDVRKSTRLTDSPVCLAVGEGDIDIHLERFLKQHNQIRNASQRILEMNPHHPLIRALSEKAKNKGACDDLSDAAWLLLDQARLIDGETLEDPLAFTKRLSNLMTKASVL